MTGMLISEELLVAVNAERDREVQELLRVRAAGRSQNTPLRRSKPWSWRVEPGMEEAFTSLRAWLLSRVGERQVEQAAANQRPS